MEIFVEDPIDLCFGYFLGIHRYKFNLGKFLLKNCANNILATVHRLSLILNGPSVEGQEPISVEGDKIGT